MIVVCFYRSNSEKASLVSIHELPSNKRSLYSRQNLNRFSVEKCPMTYLIILIKIFLILVASDTVPPVYLTHLILWTTTTVLLTKWHTMKQGRSKGLWPPGQETKWRPLFFQFTYFCQNGDPWKNARRKVTSKQTNTHTQKEFHISQKF